MSIWWHLAIVFLLKVIALMVIIFLCLATSGTIQIIHDAGGVDDNYFKMMDVEFVEGSFFTERK